MAEHEAELARQEEKCQARTVRSGMNVGNSTLAAAAVFLAWLSGSAIAMAASDTPQGSATSSAPAATAPATAPSGQTGRYVIPFYTSQTAFPTGRSVTIVAIYNDSPSACSASVQFQYAAEKSEICSISFVIPSHTSAQFCSRPVGDPLAPCKVSCPASGLIFNTGHAFVSSSKSPSTCSKIAVDPRIYYTNGTDAVIVGSSRLSITKLGAATVGD